MEPESREAIAAHVKAELSYIDMDSSDHYDEDWLTVTDAFLAAIEAAGYTVVETWRLARGAVAGSDEPAEDIIRSSRDRR